MADDKDETTGEVDPKALDEVSGGAAVDYFHKLDGVTESFNKDVGVTESFLKIDPT